MGLVVLQFLCFVLKVCAVASSLVIQGSAGYNISSLPSTFFGSPVIGHERSDSVTQWKPSRSNAPSPEFLPKGKDTHLPPPPQSSALVPQTSNGVLPSVSPTPSRILTPHSSAPSLAKSQDAAKSFPPSAPQEKLPQNEVPFLAPKASVSVPSLSRKSPQKAPTIHHVMPKSTSPSSGQNKEPHVAAPLSAPVSPVKDAPAPKEMPANPPHAHPIMSEAPSSIQPVPGASSPSELPRISPSMNHIFPSEPSSKSPEPHFLPGPTPIINRKRADEPVAAPTHGKSNQISPKNSSPTKARSMPKARRHVHYAPPPLLPPKSPPNVHYHTPPPLLPPKSPPNVQYHTPPPLLPPKSPPNVQYHTPIPLPSNSVHRPHHKVMNISSPVPSYLVPPTASAEQGPSTHPAPLYPPKLDPKSRRRQHVASPPNPASSHSISHPSSGHVSPAPSPSPKSPSGQIKVPFLIPKTRRFGSSPRNPKAAPTPPIQALPPPPPNEDCASLTCTEPLTNTPPGTPCSCVWPMQVGLRLSVAVYSFFPLVSELAKEIAIGVFMKLCQVRIMGANAASEDAEKTIVLLNLVPLGERFDSTTAYLVYLRFWNKKVAINASFFGDYEVLYVRYPGLPPSPPLPPSSINIINSEPYSGHDNNGRTTKPLGVDVRRQQHKNGLNGSVIAIIVLSALVAMILCCAVVWIFLFKRPEHIYQPEETPQTTVPSNVKSSGIPASITGSGLNSASLSFGSSIAYTGSAKTFSSSEIERATDNLNVSRILGEGGFGRVYSGMLEDRTTVAVKVLKRDDQQGSREFLAEVEMLSRLHHRNLVKLIGICIEDRIRCLVYELIPNGSVESHLHGVDKETAPLDWSSRMKIALGAARGLAYLHEDSSPRVIHRDFKSSNILLEHDFTPKLSDFGLARTALDEENSHISTRVMGTFGYVAPEYAMTGHLLVKSDVYSYGVVLLELLTGRKPVDMSQPPGQENLVLWTRPLLTSNQGLEAIVDPSLGPDFPFDSIAKVAAIASMCVQPEVSHRPFMGEVVQALKLVCNDSDETKELRSRSCSPEDLSVGMDDRISTTSDHLADPQNQSPFSNYDYGIDVERGIPVSEIFSSSARYGRQDSGSFRRHSSSGPLQKGKGRRLWERMRARPGSSVSEHGLVFKLWSSSH